MKIIVLFRINSKNSVKFVRSEKPALEIVRSEKLFPNLSQFLSLSWYNQLFLNRVAKFGSAIVQMALFDIAVYLSSLKNAFRA